MSKAAKLLKEKLHPGVTIASVAKDLGVSRQVVWAWLDGRSRPKLEQILALRDMHGIPVEAWAE